MIKTIVLDQDYGYNQFRYSGDANVIDASAASFIVANIGTTTNRYPFLMDGMVDHATVIGGTIIGEVSQTLDWVDAYVNSAAVLVRDSYSVDVLDWSISRAWDGIRITGPSDDFTISNVYMTEIRDDAIESDDGNSGTIRDSFFDGVFCGISLADSGTPDSAHKVVTIDNVILKMQTYSYKGEMTHCSPLKVEDTSPSLQIYDSVFAITDVSHIRMHKTQMIWDKVIDASGNYYLNLSDDPFPSDYPLPGEGWTVLEGQAAWDFYNAEVAAWHAGDSDADTDTGTDTSTDTDAVADSDAGTATDTQPPVSDTSGTPTDDQTTTSDPVVATDDTSVTSGDSDATASFTPVMETTGIYVTTATDVTDQTGDDQSTTSSDTSSDTMPDADTAPDTDTSDTDIVWNGKGHYKGGKKDVIKKNKQEDDDLMVAASQDTMEYDTSDASTYLDLG